MFGTDDLATVFNPPPDATVQYAQGQVITWEPDTGHNAIQWFGGTLTDVSVLSDINALTIQAEDLVGMLGWVSPGGISTWWVIGRIVAPGAGATSLVIRGGSIAIENHSLFARGHGGVTIQDDAILVSEYQSGRHAVYVGPILAAGARIGYGLLIQDDSDDQHDLLQVYQHIDGRRIAGFGDSAGPVDEFIVHSEELDLSAGGTAQISSDTLLQLLSTGQTAIGGSAGVFMQPESGAGAANMHLDPVTGRITYVPSTARLKRDIRDLEVDPDVVLQIRPRSWLPGPGMRHCPDWLHATHTDPSECCDGEMVEPPADARREVGFVAEELDAIGLGDFVDYDEEGLPASIRYDRLTAALVPLVQQQQAQITALSERVAALESGS